LIVYLDSCQVGLVPSAEWCGWYCSAEWPFRVVYWPLPPDGGCRETSRSDRLYAGHSTSRTDLGLHGESQRNDNPCSRSHNCGQWTLLPSPCAKSQGPEITLTLVVTIGG